MLEISIILQYVQVKEACEFPGETDDVLVEILAEVYGLISGPPAWRKSLITVFNTFSLLAYVMELLACPKIIITCSAKVIASSIIMFSDVDALSSNNSHNLANGTITCLIRFWNFSYVASVNSTGESA